jgi:hypothetical protein
MAPQIYQILDVRLSLDSDSEELLSRFEQDYSWFAGQVGDGRQRLSVFLSEKNQVLRINEVVLPLKDQPHPAAYAHQVIGRMLMGEIRDFFILHAAAVAGGNKAVSICGPPGSGKTTLTIGLMEAGLRLLSDDFCPIHRETGLVHPFPRSLWISRPSKFAGRGKSEDPRGSVRGKKIPLKPSSPGVVLADGPCRLHSLIYLDPGDGFDEWHEFQIGLKSSGEAGFLKGIRGLGKQMMVKKIGPELPEWQIRYPKGLGLTKAVRGLLSGYREHIWNVFRVNGGSIDFTKEPVLTPIPNHEAAFLVMSELKQELALGRGPEPGAIEPMRYFMELNELLEETACYRVTSGKLEVMVGQALKTLD